MKKKLTLSIEKNKIEKIKEYAIRNSFSVSKFVENAIDSLPNEKHKKKSNLDITKVIGAFGKAPKNFNWKKVKTDYLVKKYLSIK